MEQAMNISVIDYDDDYADETVAMWKASQQESLGFDYAPERYLHFLRTGLIITDKVYLALDINSGRVVGFMATDGHSLNQLYIHSDYQRMGIGSQLVDVAKRLSSGRLETRTFEINDAAKSFYVRHGFKPAGRDHDKCRDLEEVIYEWAAPQLACQS